MLTSRSVTSLFLGLFAALTLVLAGCSSTDASTTTIGADALVSTVQETDAVIVDVRTPGEYAAGHVEGALNVDVESPDFDERIAGLDPTQAYVVYCRSGNRSRTAADKMAEAGFEAVYNVDAGLATLSQAGVPLVR